MMGLNLSFIEIDTRANKPKATIHITGKLGFNMEAQKLMRLSDDSYYRVALDEDEEEVTNIYFVASTKDEQGALKIAKAGQYFYANLTTLFDKLKLDYAKYTIAFDIEKSKYEDKDMFIFKKRKKDRPRTSEDNSEDGD